MLPFVLYFVTALVTGYHVYALLSLTVYGAPFSPLLLVSLMGSICLLMAAYISLFRPHAAARIALLALLAMWSFYGPAIAQIVRTKVMQTKIVRMRMSPSTAVTSTWTQPRP
jgi:hypothetical protein